MKGVSEEKKVQTESQNKFDSIEESLSKNLQQLQKVVEEARGQKVYLKIKNLALIYTVDDNNIEPSVRFLSNYMKLKNQIAGATELELYQMVSLLKIQLETNMLLRMMQGPMNNLGKKIVENVIGNMLPNMQNLFKSEFNQFLTQLLANDKELSQFLKKPLLIKGGK